MLDKTPDDLSRDTGGWYLVDPRPIQKDTPYTFFLPSNEEKAALVVRDIVKLEFASHCERLSTERMWLELERKTTDGWVGRLLNAPCDLEGLAVGDRVTFPTDYILSVHDLKVDTIMDEDLYRQTCQVDARILSGDVSVLRLERRKPRRKRLWNWLRDRPRDSGWHVFANAEQSLNDMQMVSLGAVLNRDDGFLPFLDAPFGTELRRTDKGFEVC